MPMVLHRADIDRRSSLLDRRYRPFFGKNATAANSFDNSMVNCRQRESSVITVATYVATVMWPHMWPQKFAGHICGQQIFALSRRSKLLRELAKTLSSAADSSTPTKQKT